MASRKFCCCLPVRLGVFVLSAASIVLSGFTVYGLWYTVIGERSRYTSFDLGLDCLPLPALLRLLHADTFHKGTVDSSMSNINWNTTQYQNATLSDWQNQLNGLALDKQQLYAFIVVGVIMTLYFLFSIFG